MKPTSRYSKFNWRSFVAGLGTMLLMYILCYPIRYLAMLYALEPSRAPNATGTQLIEKAATTPMVVLVEVITLLPIFGFSTWTLTKKQRTSNIVGVGFLLLLGLFLVGPIREISDYPTIATIEIAAASLFTAIAYWLSVRGLKKASCAAVTSDIPKVTGSPHS